MFAYSKFFMIYHKNIDLVVLNTNNITTLVSQYFSLSMFYYTLILTAFPLIKTIRQIISKSFIYLETLYIGAINCCINHQQKIKNSMFLSHSEQILI